MGEINMSEKEPGNRLQMSRQSQEGNVIPFV